MPIINRCIRRWSSSLSLNGLKRPPMPHTNEAIMNIDGEGLDKMNTTDHGPILVTGAAGQLGAVGRTVTKLLLERGLPVRAMVRREDERAAALRAIGAKVVIGDLLEPAD